MNARTLHVGSALIAAAAILLSSGGRPAASAAPKPVTHKVTIDGTRFQPESLTIHVGDSVVWANSDPFPHTATAASEVFDSKDIAPGKSWKYTANRKGELAYACTYHPTMKGVLQVQ